MLYLDITMDNIYCPWLVNDNQHKCDVFVSNYRNPSKQYNHNDNQLRSSGFVESQKNITNPRNQQRPTARDRQQKQCWPDDFRNTYQSSLPNISVLRGLVKFILMVLLATWLTNSLSESTFATAARTTSHSLWRYNNGIRESTSSQFVNSNFAYNPLYNTQGNIAYNDRKAVYRDRQSHSMPDIQEPVLYDYNSVHVSHNLEALGGPTNFLRTQNFKISPKPCSIGRVEGTCMFVWECIKSEGRHVGMCVDSFMFGSCCAHNYTDNIVLPNSFSYTRPTKPIGMASMNHRPPQHAHRPSISGMTTIERPHGAGTLVIRPSGPHHQGPLSKPQQQQKPSHLGQSITTTATTTTQQASDLWVDSNNVADMQETNNIPAVHLVNQHQWYLTTEPNFITKPRPTSSWEKPISLRPKPPKPSKKPINSTLLWMATQHHQQQQQQQQQHQQLHYIRPTVRPTSFATLGHNSSTTRKPTKPPKPTTLWPLTMLTGTSTAITSNTDSSTTTNLASSLSTANKPLTLPPNTRPTIHSATAISIINQQTTTTTTTTTTAKPYSNQPAINIINHTNNNNSLLHTFKPPATNLATSTPAVEMQQNFSASATSVSTTAAQIPTHILTNTTTVGLNNLLQKPTKYTTTTTTTTTTTARPSSSSAFPSRPYSNNTVSYAGSSVLPETLTTIESNEITDNGRQIIKTISVARSECGMPVLARPETRIVGGKSAAFGRWPWQVSVRRTSFFGFSSTHRCGGALINENWIATAGHCVDDLLISQIRIRVGEYDFSHVQEQLPYIERGVTKKIVHPQYNFFTYEYDLALVKLEQALEFAPHVSPICLPQTNSLLIGMNATVTGWGRLSEGGTLPSVLQEVSVPIVSNDNCKSMFLRAGRQEFIPEIFLCAGYETGGQDSCQGDSGGPLQVKSQDGRYFLAGIISWGIGCAEANLPGVCTRISKFVPWIIENVT